MEFQQLAGVALPCEQRLHFRRVSWRASARRVELHLQLLVL